MSRKSQRQSPGSLLGSLAWPFILGSAAAGGFYYAVFRGPLQHPLVSRYFAGHPINMVETTLFCVGLIALLYKVWSLLGQQASLGYDLLPDQSQGQPVSKAS